MMVDSQHIMPIMVSRSCSYIPCSSLDLQCTSSTVRSAMSQSLDSADAYRLSVRQILRQLSPLYVVSHHDVLEAAQGFLSRASGEQLAKLLSKTVFRGRGQTGPPVPNVPEPRNPFETPSQSSAGVRSASRIEQSPPARFDTRSPPPRVRLRLLPPCTPQPDSDQTSPRSAGSTSNLGSRSSASTTADLTSPRSRPEIDENPQPPNQLQKQLRRILRALPDSAPYVPDDFKSEPQRLWTETWTILPHAGTDDDAVEQHRRCRRSQEANTTEIMRARVRNRMLKILRGDQLSYVEQRIRASEEGNIDRHLQGQFGIPIKEIRTIRELWKRYVALMEKFGPGTIMVLGGRDTE